MDEKEFKEALGSLGPWHPVRRALDWKLDQMREVEVSCAVAPNLASEARHFNAGRLAMVLDVIEVLKSA